MKKKKGFRDIIVDGEKWQWKVGRNFVVAFSYSTGKKCLTDVSAITNWSWSAIERSLWKGSSWHVGPRHIAKWLKSVVRQQEVV